MFQEDSRNGLFRAVRVSYRLAATVPLPFPNDLMILEKLGSES